MATAAIAPRAAGRTPLPSLPFSFGEADDSRLMSGQAYPSGLGGGGGRLPTLLHRKGGANASTGPSPPPTAGKRPTRASSQGASLSLAWDGASAGSRNSPQPPIPGKRQFGGNVEAPSKEAYAAFLRDQIAEKNAASEMDNRASRGDNLMRCVGSSSNSYVDSMQEKAMNPLPMVPLLPTQAKADYAEELRAQIESRAKSRADERAARLAEDREDDLRVERDRAQYMEQKQKERDSQLARHRVVQARADALEKFLGEHGESMPLNGRPSPEECAQQFDGGLDIRRPLGGGGYDGASMGEGLPPAGAGRGPRERRGSISFDNRAPQVFGGEVQERPAGAGARPTSRSTSRTTSMPPGGRSTLTLG